MEPWLVLFAAVVGLFGCGTENKKEQPPADEQIAETQDPLACSSSPGPSGPPSTCRTAVVSASKTIPFPPPQATPTYADGHAAFAPPMNIALPTEIPVIAGNSGHGRVVLTVGTAAGPTTCTYEGYKPLPHHPEKETPANPGDRYVFLSCSGGASPGSNVTATSVDLHVQSSSFNAGTTSVRLTLVEEAPCAGGFDCSTAVIDDGNACTADACTAAAGVTHSPVAAGTSCSDGNACNGVETCSSSGTCVAGTPPTVDDGNVCTTDACTASGGVTHTPVAVGTSCADADVCNGAETCGPSGACVAGTPPIVDDGNVCTTDACTASGGVTHTPVAVGTSCADADACNGIETCSPTGACQAGTPPVVDDGNVCTADVCSPSGGVTHTPVAVGTSCADADPCNGAETCGASGTCVAGAPPTVDDGNVCTADACAPDGSISHTPTPGVPCGVATDLCSAADQCDAAGACVLGPTPNVDDGDASTIDYCVATTGVHHVAAPPIDRTVATTVYESLKFLFTGASPIQSGVATGTITLRRAAGISGHVTFEDGSGAMNAEVSIVGHPEYGTTIVDYQGNYRMAVNGGGTLVVSVQYPGYLESQRRVEPAWNDYAHAADAVLVGVDPDATEIEMNAADYQYARGTTQTDALGTRRATVIVPAGTLATMHFPDGSTQPLVEMTVRATEYTVGPDGRDRMPAELPPTSGYTYAVELNADEAVDAGATSITFDDTLPLYFENFRGFAVGSKIPNGVYDRQRSTWVAEKNGIVLKIISISAGYANVDITGDGVAESTGTLETFGITVGEREVLADLYGVGQELWRMPLAHFSVFDCNAPTKPDCSGDCGPPPGTPPPDGGGGPPPPPDGCKVAGSVIECDNGIVGERIAIPGTPVVISHFSDRTSGFTALRDLSIPYGVAGSPSTLKAAQVEVTVAGRTFLGEISCPCASNATFDMTWDGKDEFGRLVQGSSNARITVRHFYPPILGVLSQEYAFGLGLEIATTLNPTYPIPASLTGPDAFALYHRTQRSVTVPLGTWDASAFGMGGWSLSSHHAYDFNRSTLYDGDGTRRDTGTLPTISTRVAQATQVDAAAAMPDGSLVYGDFNGIHRRYADGTVVDLTNDPNGCNPDADGIPAIYACANSAFQVIVGPDENIYFLHNEQARRIDKDGIVHLVAGKRPSLSNDSGDEGDAKLANLSFLTSIAVGQDLAVYIGTDRHHIKRVTTDGRIHAFAGNGTSAGPLNDGGPATLASIGAAWGLAVGPDGAVYAAELDRGRIRKITPQGIATTYAGAGSNFSGNGIDKSAAQFFQPDDLTVARDGSLYVHNRNTVGWNGTTPSFAIRLIDPLGKVKTIAGTGNPDCTPTFTNPCDDVAATRMSFLGRGRMAVSPEHGLIVSDGNARRVVRLHDPLASLPGAETFIPAEGGDALHVFDVYGRHTSTIDPTTNTELEHITYDLSGRVSAITDRDGLVTTIERNASTHLVTAIVGPYGHRTELTINAQGDLAKIKEPTSAEWDVAYTNHQITSFENPNGHASTLVYDTHGRLTSDHDAGGSGYTIARTVNGSAWTSTLTSAAGRVTAHANDRAVSGSRTRGVTFSNGLTSNWSKDPTNLFSLTLPNGVLQTTSQTPDPRFGLLDPLGTMSTRQPSGKTRSVTRGRSLTYHVPGEILNVDTKTDTITVNGKTATIVYDADTDIETITSPAGRVVTNSYDDVGHLLKREVPLVLPVIMTYDPSGRISTSAQGTRQTSWTYGTDGMVETITNPLNEVTSFTRDANGRVTATVRPDLEQTLIGYDAAGNIIHVLPPDKPTHDFTFNASELVTNYSPPNAASGATPTAYTYNLDKQLTDEDQPGPRNVHVTYDFAGRHSTTTFPTGTLTKTYDTAGRLSTFAGPANETLTYTYDGSLLLSTQFSGDVAGTVAWTYDDDFRPTNETINGGSAAAMSYDNDSLLTAAGALTINRDAQNGRVTGTAVSDLTDAYTFNDYGEVSGYQAATSSTSLLSFAYTRDALGRIATKTETVLGVTKTFVYSYNNVGRLTDVTENGTAVEHYVYDANGNRTSSTNLGGTFAATFDDQDRIQTYGGLTYTFNANGDLAYVIDPSAGTTGYTYDALGNLRQVALPTATIQYLVDAEGRRVGKKVNGTLVQGFLWRSKLQPVAELDGSGNVVARFVYGARNETNVPDLVVKGGATYRLVKDHLGSVRLVVNTATGAVAQEIAYDAWGQVLADTNPGFQPFGFAGGLYDADTGLVRFGARDYDAVIGRWTARDPIGLSGGVNLYGYAGENPVAHVDPTGRYVVDSYWDSKEAVKTSEDEAPDFEPAPDAGGWGFWDTLKDLVKHLFSGPTACATPDDDKCKGLTYEFCEEKYKECLKSQPDTGCCERARDTCANCSELRAQGKATRFNFGCYSEKKGENGL